MSEWLKVNTDLLKQSDVPSARLDALVLLEDATGKSRTWLLANTDFELNTDDYIHLSNQIKRRAKHEPLAYIRGRSEFYGREFKVTPATLQPRTETETMIEMLLRYAEGIEHFIDVGTGSGCLAITTKLELANTRVCATDINEDALSVARENATLLQADVSFYRCNLIEFLTRNGQRVKSEKTFVLANLPYVPNSHTINQAAMHEPKIAIFGGEDGLDSYRQLFNQISDSRHEISHVLTESLPFQHGQLKSIAESNNYRLKDSQDLIQVFELI